MSIQKQEFYEGAALHRLIRGGGQTCIGYEHPLFVLNGEVRILLKYSTAGRSPWSFTFGADEQAMMVGRAEKGELIIGLICGSDGIVALPLHLFSELTLLNAAATRVVCERGHRGYFEVRGPKGTLSRKIPPSDWDRLSMSFEELK